MRLNQKKQILNLLQTIDYVHEEIDVLVQNYEYDASERLLAECQDAAISIGNVIEESEGEENQIVKYLEEYCETLYQSSKELTDKTKFHKTYKNLKKKIRRIMSEIDEYIESTYEIVFLPYHASMWDSMESVWIAAQNDANCKTYVIPIPFFDKKPDGTLNNMYYESDVYPDYVPITDWTSYDMEKQRPDAIYIHNPYDSENFVTSVHPNYYAKNLKKYTNMLVYLFYFVVIDNIEPHLCINAGTLYADKVIVQSETVKRTCIKEFEKFGKDNNCSWELKSLETKFLALGSPKFDKVFSMKQDVIFSPANWQSLIRGEDGNKKKVVLYNTTLVAMLKDTSKMLYKITDVINLFSQRKDVILLWRPHPLMRSTMEAMRPNFMAQYNNIVSKFQSEATGIYDDTPDLHRAIAISDAYYGDWSSVVALYRVTGKPILIQNVNIT